VPSLVNRQQLDAAHEAHEIVDFFSALAEEKGVALHVTGAGSVSADEALFRIVLTNLISNALRHTPRGGSITIHIAPANGAGTAISVTDTGAGIGAEHLHRIFDRFYRADAARGEGSEGAGLGLALVQSILNLHGGAVAVESTQGAGTVFRLTFPGPPA
jgi:two-component system heavy metal sensor histidine kinase CusS